MKIGRHVQFDKQNKIRSRPSLKTTLNAFLELGNSPFNGPHCKAHASCGISMKLSILEQFDKLNKVELRPHLKITPKKAIVGMGYLVSVRFNGPPLQMVILA